MTTAEYLASVTQRPIAYPVEVVTGDNGYVVVDADGYDVAELGCRQAAGDLAAELNSAHNDMAQVA